MIKLKEKVTAIAVSSFLALAGATSVGAQDIDTSAEFVTYLKALSAGTQSQKNVYAPSVMHATVAPSGTGFIGLNLFTPRGGVASQGADGSMSMGVGFGDVDGIFGGSLALNTTGLVPFGTDGDFSLRLVKTIGQTDRGKTLVGIQFNRLVPWGSNVGDPKSYDAAFTHFGTLSAGATPYIATIGYGSHNGIQGKPGMYFAFGIGVTEALGYGMSVKAGELNIGVGYKVARVPGMSLTFDVANINRFDRGQIPAANSQIFTIGINFTKSDLFGRN